LGRRVRRGRRWDLLRGELYRMGRIKARMGRIGAEVARNKD